MKKMETKSKYTLINLILTQYIYWTDLYPRGIWIFLFKQLHVFVGLSVAQTIIGIMEYVKVNSSKYI